MTQPVVDVYEVEPGIVQVTMQDRVHKNTFTEELMLGMIRAFESIRESTKYKVVILTGYDSYFSSGGTQEELLVLQEGKRKFTDMNICSLALDCTIPVIAAMQGHGIGGGFVMGLFADFVILSRECLYRQLHEIWIYAGSGCDVHYTKEIRIQLSGRIIVKRRKLSGSRA
jgi:polyketide biosynthesis enoyl-CoA hydratase PksI